MDIVYSQSRVVGLSYTIKSIIMTYVCVCVKYVEMIVKSSLWLCYESGISVY